MSSAWSQGMSFRRSVRLPGDGVAGDDVEAREVGDDLQHRAHFDVLEIERQLLALVAALGALRELVGVLVDGLDLQDEAVVGLVGGMLPQSLGFDDHPRVAALRERVDRDHRRAEIVDVEPALEVARQRSLEEIHDQVLALLPDVDACGIVGEVDDDPAFTALAAPEIDVAQRMRRVVALGFGKALHLLGLCGRRGLIRQRDQDRIALDVGLEGLRLVEVEHDARAIAGLDEVEAAQRRLRDLALRDAHAIGRIQKIEGDPRRALHGEPGGRIGRRRFQLEPDDGFTGRSARDGDLLEAVARLGLRQRHARKRKRTECDKAGRPSAARRRARA